ncbi:MAG: response regulator [Pseudotabrizicola sp.]|nr:response regulator [Pseudotabrizicola sp.]
MVLGYVVVGMVGGAVGFVASLTLGASFWSAILTYGLVGSISTLILPIARLASDSAQHVTPTNADTATSVTPVAGQVDHVVPNGAEAAPLPATDVKMRILAVDDDPFILELVPKIAAKVGCPDITTVNSGADALAMIAQADKPFDCLLLDINMPGMDGIELCARIRATPGYDEASIIMLTAMTDTDYLERAFIAGANDYTSKPFDITEFGERMQIAQAWTAVRRADLRGEDGRGMVGNDPSRDSLRASKLLPGVVKAHLLINEDALQNYLARLPSSDQVSAYVMAIALDEVAELADAQPSAEVLTGLARVAVAIDDVFKVDGYVMAFADEGRFIVVSRAHNLPAAQVIEAAIQDRLDKEQMETGAERRDPPQVSVGNAVRPGGRSSQRARMAVNSAVHLAEARQLQKIGIAPPIPAIRA